MLKFAPRNPQERFETIDTGWRQLGHESSEFLQGAGIRISRNPLLVYGKILPLPEIKYGSGSAQYVSMISGCFIFILSAAWSRCLDSSESETSSTSGDPKLTLHQLYWEDLWHYDKLFWWSLCGHERERYKTWASKWQLTTGFFQESVGTITYPCYLLTSFSEIHTNHGIKDAHPQDELGK